MTIVELRPNAALHEPVITRATNMPYKNAIDFAIKNHYGENATWRKFLPDATAPRFESGETFGALIDNATKGIDNRKWDRCAIALSGDTPRDKCP
jgi:hypothetical protein